MHLLLHRESADKVVLHTGKYEELIVCSHEIAASTAQLVAASKVGPPPLLTVQALGTHRSVRLANVGVGIVTCKIR